jgi:hypothetical protein
MVSFKLMSNTATTSPHLVRWWRLMLNLPCVQHALTFVTSNSSDRGKTTSASAGSGAPRADRPDLTRCNPTSTNKETADSRQQMMTSTATSRWTGCVMRHPARVLVTPQHVRAPSSSSAVWSCIGRGSWSKLVKGEKSHSATEEHPPRFAKGKFFFLHSCRRHVAHRPAARI